MQPERTLFISSCTRREMARRRPHRSTLRLQLLVGLVAVAAVVAVMALRGAL
jgi:hypothetical protein